MKLANDVLGKVKGEDHINDVITGKGSYSRAGFGDLVNAMANDTSFKIPVYGKDGTQTGETCLSELIRADLKKTIEKANYPQKPESAILDTCEIYTSGLAEAIPQIIMQQLACGKKMDLPAVKDSSVNSIYLADVPARTKTSTIRDPKTQEVLGSVTATNEPYVALKAKSPAPASKVTKVRKGNDGKVID